MALKVDDAKKFFGSLYDRSHAPDLGHFEAAALRLVATVENNDAVPTKDVAAGDKALGLLMLNHIMSTPNIEQKQKAALSAAALLNIKSELVGRFTELFPEMTVSELTKAAEKAGYHVEVLDSRVAANVPRSVVGR
ncbi:hypothetical protein [Janthinobacterium fluminis]|uniref:Uncharacterized protein n=1 Tax=Janthinobacterium fluminis TaxID=2987524 RepID=A0ABT5K1U3_9BURK|nr:hypothetical protein [Janthinobacterium fluminis]MDC8758410.1 hypothetical protein [Janthinobacterium fluminis]